MREAEFESAAMPHLRDIYRTATRLLSDSTQAEDVAQDVYLEAWKSFHRFEPGTNCRAWLFKILFHVIHHHRRNWFHARAVPNSEEILERVAASEDAVTEHMTYEEIIAALDRVPEDFRAVILLVDVEEFSYKEAAEILNVPIGTIMSRLSRGWKLLRQELQAMARSFGIGRARLEGRTA